MDAFLIIILAILGSILGSFLGCMGYRIPNKIKTTYPSSFCSNCKKPLKWYMNIPILSYTFLGGKCAYCKSKIGFIYYLCEILGFILLPLNYLLFDISLEFFLTTILSLALIVTIVSDFEYFYISDRVLVISGLISLICIYLYLGITETITRVITGILLFITMYLIKLLGNALFKRESLGDGDIKLMGIIGIVVGFINSFVTLFIGSILALIYSLIIMKKNKEGIVPFGPFLILGSMLSLYFTDFISSYILTYLAI